MSEVSTFVETWDTLLRHFCSRDDLRPGMCQPNIVGNFVYATDAYSWIKVPYRPSFRDYGCHVKVPNFASVESTFKLIEPIEILQTTIESALSKFDKRPDWVECQKCSGQGEIECHCCGNKSHCLECDGIGSIDDYTLPEVYDNGPENGGAIEILANIVAPFQLGRLLRVLEFLKADRVFLWTNEKRKGLLFRASDLEIVVMPLMNEGYEYSKRVKLDV